MDFRKLGNLLVVGGAAVVAAAILWWLFFYSAIMRELAQAPGAPPGGNSVFDALSCLYSNRDVCGFIAGFARLLGRTPYEPMVLWVGLAGLILGVLIRVTAKPSGGLR